ncbi:hypothetical protein CA13_62700 [Planctomycetes bacterium CA13]|uniref:HEAT repeat protein n=1 Tax=Novipirellula herctigrandis TaxID=2527986 RepID=A0A5C5ZCB4_9BACT|nr:hypothetical protein CA13_62700 [Planctomycetes bacterium CA13]
MLIRSAIDGDKGNSAAIADLYKPATNLLRLDKPRAIGQVLFDKPELFRVFESTINLLITDWSPSVRMGAINICFPILNLDRNKAVQLFLAGCDLESTQQRDGILSSHIASDFLRYALHSHSKELAPIILSMKNSSQPELQMTGAQWIISERLQHGAFEEEIGSCIKGSVEHRKWLPLSSMIAPTNVWNA